MQVCKRLVLLECKGLPSIVGFHQVDVSFKGTVHLELKTLGILSSFELHINELLSIELCNGQGLKCRGKNIYTMTKFQPS